MFLFALRQYRNSMFLSHSANTEARETAKEGVTTPGGNAINVSDERKALEKPSKNDLALESRKCHA